MSVNSKLLAPELEQRHGVFWKCVDRTETGCLFRLRNKYRHLDYSWGSSDPHYGLNKAAREKQSEIFPVAEDICAGQLRWRAEKLKEFGYRFFEDANGSYFLELPSKKHLAGRIQEKWPAIKEGIGKGENVSHDFLHHLFGLSDGEKFVSDHSTKAMPVLMEMLQDPNYLESRERGRASLTDLYARMESAQVDLEKRFKRGEEVIRLRFFVELLAICLGSCSSREMEEFIQIMSGTSAMELLVTEFSNQREFRSYWRRTFNDSFDPKALIKIWNTVRTYEPIPVVVDDSVEHVLEGDFDVNDPRIQSLLIKYYDKFENSMPFAVIRSKFDGVAKSEEFSAWLESEEKALKQKESTFWEATSRVRTKNGYIYEFIYKAVINKASKELEIFPAVEPVDDSIEQDILLLKEFGFDFRRDENGIYIRIPDRDHLQACIEKKYPSLKEEIVSSEGIADDIAFILAFLRYFLLISDGKEFVHDTIAHVIPTLKFIKRHGLDSYRSYRQISRDHVSKLLDKALRSERLARDTTLKGKIITLIGVDADGLWAQGSVEEITSNHKSLVLGEESMMGIWNDSSFQHFWRRIHGEEIDSDRAKAMWDQITK